MKQQHYKETPEDYAKTILSMHRILEEEDIGSSTPLDASNEQAKKKTKVITNTYMNIKRSYLMHVYVEKMKQLIAVGKPMSAETSKGGKAFIGLRVQGVMIPGHFFNLVILMNIISILVINVLSSFSGYIDAFSEN